ncbi:uncharacterized protein LOC129745632 isoform X5 [Uranotaenia lowii]|uniref:uncharacterized protein LOC129745632 isoform X5 n=1 Tax=Uranotaenia lowii TaxID=190385 RepID=UPI00247844C1|nr:uncharacterized protein LOC129745632 isoform X5 [Uranotaenia lowii]
MEFEEVEMEEDYLIEGDISDASPVKTSHEPAPKVARLVPKSEPSTSGRKIPIIRSAGAVVTPVRTAIRKPVQASPPLKMASVPVKQEKPLSVSPENCLHETDSSNKPPSQPVDQIARIENQLDVILDTIGKYNEAIADTVYKMTRARQYILKCLRRMNFNQFKRSSKASPTEKRKNSVLFPIPDQEYLERLEESLETDENVTKDLIARFCMTAHSDLYRFLRRNIENLFRNTKRYSWTGKLLRDDNLPKCKIPAKNLKSMKILLKCAMEICDEQSLKHIEKTAQIALRRFTEMNLRHYKNKSKKVVN